MPAAATEAQQLQVDAAPADEEEPSQPSEHSGGGGAGPYEFTCLYSLMLSSSAYDTARFNFSRRAGALHSQLATGLVVASRYRLVQLIGQGSHGAVYKCDDLRTGGMVALKARVSDVSGLSAGLDGGCGWSQLLDRELDVYIRLGAHQAQPPQGIPAVYSAGVHMLKPPASSQAKPLHVSYIAMQLLDCSIWSECRTPRQKGPMPREFVVEVGRSMLQALASLHSLGFMHRDVKTANTCFVEPSSYDVVLIDFGFTREAFGHYNFAKYGRSIASFVGTPNYSSLDSLLSLPQSPKDDLEAMVYCLAEMEMPRCLLPWNDSLTTNAEAAQGWSKQQLAAMSNQKRHQWQRAVQEGALPQYLCNMAAYVMKLRPSEVPDYAWLMRCLQRADRGAIPLHEARAVQYSAWRDAVRAAQQGHPAAVNAAREHILAELRTAAAQVLPRWAVHAAAAAAGYTVTSSATTLEDTEVLDEGDDDEGCDSASCELRMSQCNEEPDGDGEQHVQQYERYVHEQQYGCGDDDDEQQQQQQQQQQHGCRNDVPAAAAWAASLQPLKRPCWDGVGTGEQAGGVPAAADDGSAQAALPDEQCDIDGELLEEPKHYAQQPAKRRRMALWHADMAVPSGSDGSQPYDGGEWDD